VLGYILSVGFPFLAYCTCGFRDPGGTFDLSGCEFVLYLSRNTAALFLGAFESYAPTPWTGRLQARGRETSRPLDLSTPIYALVRRLVWE